MPKDHQEVKNNRDGGVEKNSGANEALCTVPDLDYGHQPPDVRVLIQLMNFSFGTTILLPIFRDGNLSLFTNSYAPALLIPSTAATSGTESISGNSS